MKKLLVLAVLFAAMQGVSVADHDVDCFGGRGSTFGKFISPKNGVVQVQTTPTGPIVLSTGSGAPAVVLSTDGTYRVRFEYQCVTSIQITATRDGETTPFYSSTRPTECNHLIDINDVPIGLEVGSYSFELYGTSCDEGLKLRRDANGGFVADPPVL